jgi:hypothetical protein
MDTAAGAVIAAKKSAVLLEQLSGLLQSVLSDPAELAEQQALQLDGELLGSVSTSLTMILSGIVALQSPGAEFLVSVRSLKLTGDVTQRLLGAVPALVLSEGCVGVSADRVVSRTAALQQLVKALPGLASDLQTLQNGDSAGYAAAISSLQAGLGLCNQHLQTL